MNLNQRKIFLEFNQFVNDVAYNITLSVIELVSVKTIPSDCLAYGLLKVAAAIAITSGCSRESFTELSQIAFDEEHELSTSEPDESEIN